jgi:hypothetical protein
LDHDVAAKARKLVAKLKKPFRQVINQALRVGLEELEAPAQPKPYRTKPHAMGVRDGFSLDNIAELLAHIDGENRR